MDTKTCAWYPGLLYFRLLSVPGVQLWNDLLSMMTKHHIDTQHCKTIMTLSDHDGEQIIRDTIPCFLEDFEQYLLKRTVQYAKTTTCLLFIWFMCTTSMWALLLVQIWKCAFFNFTNEILRFSEHLKGKVQYEKTTICFFIWFMYSTSTWSIPCPRDRFLCKYF
jgi:hypothetical protein